jgi:hypothetical protein
MRWARWNMLLQNTRPQRDQELRAMRVVMEAGLAAIPTIDEGVDRVGILDSEPARHDRDVRGPPHTCR